MEGYQSERPKYDGTTPQIVEPQEPTGVEAKVSEPFSVAGTCRVIMFDVTPRLGREPAEIKILADKHTCSSLRE